MPTTQEKLEKIVREAEKLSDAQLDLALVFIQFLSHSNGIELKPSIIERPAGKQWLGPTQDMKVTASLISDDDLDDS